MAAGLLSGRHGLLRAWRHLRVATSARVPLALLLLPVERRRELRRLRLLAVLVLHVWRKALVRARVRHHVRARARRSSVAIQSRTLLRHVRHVRLCVRRHRRVALVLRRHEATGRRVLSHQWRTSAHLRHVRTESRAGRETRAHLVHCVWC